LKDAPKEYRPLSAAAQAVQAQATSLTWSLQADFGIEPAPILDASFLVVGTRGGILHFLRFENGSINPIVKIKVSNDWLTHLAFSSWTVLEAGKCQGCLAYGTSSGAVGLVIVAQSLNPLPSESVYGPTFDVAVRLEHHTPKVFDPDKRGLTALTWVLCNGNVNPFVFLCGALKISNPVDFSDV